ncbi:hypothetical protein GI374_18250 [Paracoccus sp. S-4012]|uniref:YciI family protein n=1 Tax=Paracoccus sp. S-4012 TaxID=2665648 RepID=UPI0012AF6CD2|nr:YciI family protein [Paracoccus sp. S-4012]MRX52283.1 hypothetical protein [Paracoccus sp. S-4012]
MRFAALFLDDVDPASLDPALTRAHFDYLAAHGEAISDAGGLRAEPGGPFCGSLWVIEAEDIETARRLVAGDPYCLAGLRPDSRVFVWGRAPIRPSGHR